MRRIFLLLLAALLLLTACGAPAGQEAEEILFPPETGPAGAVSAPAIVTEGRAPAENYDLPTVPAVPQTDLLRDEYHYADSGVIELLAELPEADAAFYGLPSSEDVRKTALIRWGESLAEFDWDFAAGLGWPQLFCFDFDSDGEEELVLTCYADSGVGTSVYDLHVVEKTADGTLTDCALPESLWREQLAERLILAYSGDNRAWVNLGREMVEFSVYGIPKDDLWGALCVGRMTDYEFTYYSRAYAPVCLRGWVCLDLGSGDTLKCVAGYSAMVSYWDGTFMLSDMHLYDYDQ